ncbi:pyruvate formate-lyase-activating protein [Rhodopseudomonas sp. BAL398]|uniref:pyruvate formate-lyase-activating protein n=1 Tax=Rhodopseudomonas sp. BAL398 TaxID=3034676 RepID=UPI0023E263E9|nr:pyruvate formate-lyase-activating protein [Rhodopseudomonas sp. BAL398]MDF3809868.1 pyruvate formate-lyase-activating protein [Rhodopseudomonas sp. BAL398]
MPPPPPAPRPPRGAPPPGGPPAVRPAISGWVHSTEVGGAVDGPGIRYVLFLAGCLLRCQYCHNPDSWHMHQGKPTNSREVLRDIGSYTKFLMHARGGVTLSGGEPLVQPDFTHAILRGCKEMGLHTALDTAGFLGAHADDYLLADVDLVLLDIKAFSEATYHDLTGVALGPTLVFARRLAAMKKPVWIRFVLVPGLTDKFDEIEKMAAFARELGNVERVDVLPFHKMGEFKWAAGGVPYRLAGTEPPTPDLLERTRAVFRRHDLVVT